MTVSFTLHLRLAVPDFLSEPWHGEFHQAMDSIDQAIFNALIAQNTTLWLNSTTYAVGDIVIDPQTGALWTVAIAHTTAASPTLFAAYKAANPTFYVSFTLAAASQAEAEAGIENTKYMTALRVAQAIAFQSPIPGIASQAQAVAGADNTTMMTPLRTAQSIAARAGITPQGRLTLTAATPVMIATQASTANVFYSPYIGTLAPFFNGTTYDILDLWDELPTLATDTAKNPAAIGVSKVNDWFLWSDSAVVTITIAAPGVVSYTAHGFAIGQPIQLTTSGALPTGLLPDTTYYVLAAGFGANSFQLGLTNGGAAINTSGAQSGTHTLASRRLTHGPDWTNDTTRSAGTALVRVKGIWLNSIAITNGPGASRGTYIGTTRSNASSQFQWTYGTAAAGGGAAIFSVWNAYNRVRVVTTVLETTATWTCPNGTTRSMNNSAGNRVSAVFGLPEDGIVATISCLLNCATVSLWVGIGLDSIVTASGTHDGVFASGGAWSNGMGIYVGVPTAGYHFYQALESTTTTSGDATLLSTGVTQQSGMHFDARM